MRPLTRLALVPAAVIGAVLLTSAPALAAPSDQDVSWMQAAHQVNLAEIAAGNAAQQQAATSQVKQLGAMFAQMHTQLDGPLTQAAQRLGVQLPGSPTPQQQQQLAAVQQKSGQAFDTAWVALQIAGHETALAQTQQELSSGSDPTVLAQARAAAPVIQQHLSEVRAIAGQSGVPTAVPGGTGGQAAHHDSALGWALAALGVLALGAGTAGLVRRRSLAA